jgi:pyruvate,orthophosphate dikinase
LTARKKTAAKKKASKRRTPSSTGGKKAKAANAARKKKASAKAPSRQVYFFGGGKADGRADLRDIIGGKGANLAEMTSLGIPVPAGFTISTAVCAEFNALGGKFPKQLKADAVTALARVEATMGKHFGDREDPLLVSVRSGARVSMPGMMDTVLNLGLNDETVEGLARNADRRFAFDS